MKKTPDPVARMTSRIASKTADAVTAEQIQARLHGRRFLFHDDHGLTAAMKSVLAELYPVKSRFEFSMSTVVS